MPIRIILADDHVQFRTALKSLIEGESGLSVLAEVGDGVALLDEIGHLQTRPDLVVMDVRMPHMDGIEATRRIATLRPGTRVLALSMHDEEKIVLAMIAAGAHGYALKGEPLAEVLRAIRTVAGGESYFSAAFANMALPAASSGVAH